MKKITGILIPIMLITTTLFTSCEKEPPLEESIIGKWEVKSYKYIIYQGNVMKSEVTIYLETGEMAIQFAEEGIGIMYENNEMAGNFEWSLSGNTVTATFANGTVSWTINIDEDILVWSYTENEAEGDITYEYEFFYTAERTG